MVYMQHFDIAIIGSGSGNTIIDERFDEYSVALIERDSTFGGTCLNRGCIPTKMFAYPADLAASADNSGRFGIDLRFAGADWAAIRDRIFGRIDPISRGGLQWRRAAKNVTVFAADAKFLDEHRIQVGSDVISADQIVIATGSRPRELDLDLAAEVADRVHTSDTVMRIDELPRKLMIVGGGYIAMEFAHIFAALGSDVTVLNRSDVILRGHDRDVSAAVVQRLRSKVHFRFNQQVQAIEPGDDGLEVVTTDKNGVEYLYYPDAVLVATGRIRNTDSLDLSAAGVALRREGQIRVDGKQRTTVNHIWALGDCSSDYLLKHVANAEARTVQHNLLHPEDLVETDERVVPHAVFTEPQVASFGPTEEQLKSWGVPYVAYTQRYADVAAGWAREEDETHFVKLLADPTSWRLLAAHVVGPQAATVIQPLIQGASFMQRVPDLARGQFWIHPAMPEVVENALLGLLSESPALP